VIAIDRLAATQNPRRSQDPHQPEMPGRGGPADIRERPPLVSTPETQPFFGINRFPEQAFPIGEALRP
jgi:hypothetical protein